MGRTLNEKLRSLPKARRAKIEARAAELVADEMSLRDLRRALGRTQSRLAAELGVGQDTVSRYERRADMLLSTLQEILETMGARLALIAEFPDRRPVKITGFGDISPKQPSAQRRSRARSRSVPA